MAYPKVISRGLRGFMVFNEEQERQVKDFLGIDPPGVDIDTYVSKLDLKGLEEWFDYWNRVFTRLGLSAPLDLARALYNRWKDIKKEQARKTAHEYPKKIKRFPYSFKAYNKDEEDELNDFLGIKPSGDDLDTYLERFVKKGDLKKLQEWRDYWVKVWKRLGRDDLRDFTEDKFNEYKRKIEVEVTGLEEFKRAIDKIETSFKANDVRGVAKGLLSLFNAEVIGPGGEKIRTGEVPISAAGELSLIKKPSWFKNIFGTLSKYWKKILGVTAGAYGISFATSWFGKEGLIEQVSIPLRDALRDYKFSKSETDRERAESYLRKYEENIKEAEKLIGVVSWLWPFTRSDWLRYIETAKEDLALKKKELAELVAAAQKTKKAAEETTEKVISEFKEKYDLTRVKVFEVIDGDTIKILLENTGNTAKVRLVGINAPEKGQVGYKESKEWLTSRLYGSYIKLLIDKDNEKDEYGRILAVVIDEQGKDINFLSVREGWSLAYFFYKSRYVNEQNYKDAEERAKREKKGIWGLLAGKKYSEMKREEEEKEIMKEKQMKVAKLPETQVPETVKKVYVPKGKYGFAVDTTPDGAIVEYNGRKRKYTADTTYITSTGSGIIEVRMEGYEPLAFNVTLKEKKVIYFKVNLITREIEQIELE